VTVTTDGADEVTKPALLVDRLLALPKLVEAMVLVDDTGVLIWGGIVAKKRHSSPRWKDDKKEVK